MKQTKKKKAGYKVKKIKGCEAVYGVYCPEGHLLYESDKEDCVSMVKNLNR